MQLSKLKTAIRKHKGPVRAFLDFDVSLRVNVEKLSLIEQLDARFNDNTAETGLLLDADGSLIKDRHAPPRLTPTPPTPIDEEELF